MKTLPNNILLIKNTPLSEKIAEENQRIYDLIKTSKNLIFLENSIVPIQTFFHRTDYSLTTHKDIQCLEYEELGNSYKLDYYSKNSLLVEGGEFYLTNSGWNQLYANLQVYRYNNVNLDKYVMDDTLPEYYLENLLNFTFERIKQHMSLRKEKALTCLQFLLKGKFNLLEVVKISLHYNIQYYYKRNASDKKLLIEIPLNTMVLTLADNLIEYLALEHPILENYIKQYNGYKFVEPSKEIKHSFSEILQAAKKDDYKTLKTLLGPKYDNDLLIESLKNYLIHAYNTFHETNKTLNVKYKDPKETNLEKIGLHDINYKSKMIQISSIILTYLEEYTPLGEPLLKSIKHQIKEKNRWFYQVNPHVVNMLMESYCLNKPYLNLDNINFIKENLFKTLLRTKETPNKKPQTGLDILYHKKSHFIHKNDFINLKVKETSYLEENKPYLYLTINRNILYTLLETLSINLTEENINFTENLSSILYDLEYPKENSEIKQRLIIYSLTFPDDPKCAFNINEDINKLKKANNKIFIDILNKITGHKIIIINMLKDLVTYLPFKYFILDHFLDSRGRMYLNSDFINIQLYPLTKGFVNYYSFTNIHSKETYQEFKKNIIKHLSNKVSKTELTNMSFDSYKIKDKILKLSFIKTFFNNTYNIEIILSNFIKLINYPTKNDIELKKFILSTIVINIKKKNRCLYVYNLIYSYIKLYYSSVNLDLEIEDSFYELDATCSGLQMFSILFDNWDFGFQSNLIGEDKNDIYNNFTQEYNKTIETIIKAVESFLEIFTPNNTLDTSKRIVEINIKEYKNLNRSKHSILETFTLMNIRKSYCAVEIFIDILELIKKENLTISLITDIFNKTLTERNLDLNSCTWLLTSEEKEVLKYKAIPINNADLIQLLKIRSALKLYFLYQRVNLKENLIFYDRSLFKDAIMTFFYGSTNYSRKNVIIDLFLSFSKNNITYSDAIMFATYTDEFFLFNINHVLKDNTLIFTLCNILKKDKKPIKISNENLSMVYYPIKYKRIIKELTLFRKDNEKKKVRGKQITYIQKTTIFNDKEFSKGFIPNLIHYIDASIIHNFYSLIKNINAEFIKKNTLNMISCTSNHDTFNSNVGPFLRYFIEEAYLKLYRDKPIEWLLKNLPKNTIDNIQLVLLSYHFKKLNLKSLNPYFIK